MIGNLFIKLSRHFDLVLASAREALLQEEKKKKRAFIQGKELRPSRTRHDDRSLFDRTAGVTALQYAYASFFYSTGACSPDSSLFVAASRFYFLFDTTSFHHFSQVSVSIMMTERTLDKQDTNRSRGRSVWPSDLGGRDGKVWGANHGTREWGTNEHKKKIKGW